MRHGLRAATTLGVLALSQAIVRAADADPAAFARVRAYERARIEVIDKVQPSVGCLLFGPNRAGGGSGVIIDPAGYGLTNFHVVAGMLEKHAGEVGLPDGKLYSIEVLGIDPGGDVAMFRVLGRKRFAFAELGDSDTLRVGDYTLAMGNPFLLADDYTPTVTLGIVSGLHRYQAGAGRHGRALRYTDCIQVAASINPGNSGGPLFDVAGKLVGINGRVSIEERGRVNVGVGYAISINQIKRFIPMLRAGLTAKHATAGFTVADRDGAVIVDQILSDSPAYAAGLRLGDRIVRFGAEERFWAGDQSRDREGVVGAGQRRASIRAIRSANEFGSLLGTYPARWPVEVVFQRNDENGDAAVAAAAPRRIRFRLEDLPLPQVQGKQNPYGPHPVTRAANGRAVRRAFAMYHQALGGAAAVAGLQRIEAVGRRRLVGKAEAQAKRIVLAEQRELAGEESGQGRLTPVQTERQVRWMLFDPAMREYSVVGADLVQGRVCVVLAHKSEPGRLGPGAQAGPAFRVLFDDQNGRLLALAFKDAATGKRVRYEYDDYRRAGGLRLPHVRRLYLDDMLYAEDRFETITVKG